MPLRLKSRTKTEKKVPRHQLIPSALWIQFGLHRGHLFTNKGKGEGAFGYDVDAYYLGTDEFVGTLDPYGRGTTALCMKNSTVSKHILDSIGVDNMRSKDDGKWHGPLSPERWIGDHDKIRYAKSIRDSLNSGDLQMFDSSETHSNLKMVKKNFHSGVQYISKKSEEEKQLQDSTNGQKRMRPKLELVPKKLKLRIRKENGNENLRRTRA